MDYEKIFEKAFENVTDKYPCSDHVTAFRNVIERTEKMKQNKELIKTEEKHLVEITVPSDAQKKRSKAPLIAGVSVLAAAAIGGVTALGMFGGLRSTEISPLSGSTDVSATEEQTDISEAAETKSDEIINQISEEAADFYDGSSDITIRVPDKTTPLDLTVRNPDYTVKVNWFAFDGLTFIFGYDVTYASPDTQDRPSVSFSDLINENEGWGRLNHYDSECISVDGDTSSYIGKAAFNRMVSGEALSIYFRNDDSDNYEELVNEREAAVNLFLPANPDIWEYRVGKDIDISNTENFRLRTIFAASDSVIFDISGLREPGVWLSSPELVLNDGSTVNLVNGQGSGLHTVNGVIREINRADNDRRIWHFDTDRTIDPGSISQIIIDGVKVLDLSEEKEVSTYHFNSEWFENNDRISIENSPLYTPADTWFDYDGFRVHITGYTFDTVTLRIEYEFIADSGEVSVSDIPVYLYPDKGLLFGGCADDFSRSVEGIIVCTMDIFLDEPSDSVSVGFCDTSARGARETVPSDYEKTIFTAVYNDIQKIEGEPDVKIKLGETDEANVRKFVLTPGNLSIIMDVPDISCGDDERDDTISKEPDNAWDTKLCIIMNDGSVISETAMTQPAGMPVHDGKVLKYYQFDEPIDIANVRAVYLGEIKIYGESEEETTE